MDAVVILQCATQRDFKQYLCISGKQDRVSSRAKLKVTAFLARHMLRRLKSQVMDNLVSKTEELELDSTTPMTRCTRPSRTTHARASTASSRSAPPKRTTRTPWFCCYA